MNPIWTRELTAAEVRAWEERVPADGPLAGTRFAIKDNLDLEGVPTTAGLPSLDTPATATAYAVQRLLDAGAVPVGKTNLDQFATGLVGTRSPYGACSSVADPLRISGGSSSGSALAVATGLVPLALGSDTAGSGRVPAAFNGLVGVKPTRGLVSTRGLVPACRSLDCVTTLTRTVTLARRAFEQLASFDAADPYARPLPAVRPAGVAAHLRVVGVPVEAPDLEPEHAEAWQRTVKRAESELGLILVPVDLEPFLEAGGLLYGGPWVAERLAAIGHLLEEDRPGIDPTVRRIVLGAKGLSAADVFRGMDQLARLRRATEPLWDEVDALLVPTTPAHPTLADVAADPIGVNARLGTYTNFVNLLDLCAVSVPGVVRGDGLPFGVQLVAPAFADEPLLDLAAHWCGEAVAQDDPGSLARVAVCGAHLTGLPLNGDLVRLGARLLHRGRTGPGYRLYRLPGGPIARPGLVRTGDGPRDGIDVEVWELTDQALGALLRGIPAPLGLGSLTLDDGSVVPGFLAEAPALEGADDISGYAGWRGYLHARALLPPSPVRRAATP